MEENEPFLDDEESLAGLTQEPSQIAIENTAEHESSDDSLFDENSLHIPLFSAEGEKGRSKIFGILPATDLLNCSANVTQDFEKSVFAIGDDTTDSSDDEKMPDSLDVTCELVTEGNGKKVVASSVETSVHDSQIAGTSGIAKHDAVGAVDICEPLDINGDDVIPPTKPGNNDNSPPVLDHVDIYEDFDVTAGRKACHDDRFKQPRSAADMKKLSKLQVKNATKTKIDWAVRAYERWRNYRRKMRDRSELPNSRSNRYIEPLAQSIKDTEMIQDDICDFIAEVKKETGEEYPPCSLYDLVFMLSLHVEREFSSKRFVSGAFPRIRNTLDGLMKERTEMGLGLVRSKDIITEEHEEILWAKGVLGESQPDQLRRTVMFLLGIKFGLRGGAEHRSLRRYPFSQLNFEVKDGRDCLVYRERHSKMNQGGIKRRNSREPKVVYAFCSGYRPRCLLELYEKYQFYCPQPTFHWPAFYLQTNPHWQAEDFWYLQKPVGKNTLANYVKEMMEQANIPGNFSNHSLRGTTASRLYQKNVDEQLICEQTGHRSNAVRRYKRTSMDQKEQVSDMLNVLPPNVRKCATTRKSGPSFSVSKSPKRKRSSSESSDESSVKVSKANAKCVVKSSSKVVQEKVEIDTKIHENSSVPKPTGNGNSGPGGVVVVQDNPKDPIDVHVPIRPDMQSLQGLVNIHFHFAK